MLTRRGWSYFALAALATTVAAGAVGFSPLLPGALSQAAQVVFMLALALFLLALVVAMMQPGPQARGGRRRD